MSQLAYANQGKGYKGKLVDLGNTDITSHIAEEALEFGSFGVLGTDPDSEVKLPAVGTDLTNLKNHLGVVVRTHTEENAYNGAGTSGQHEIGDTVSMVKKGRVFVEVQTAFAPTDTVYVGFQNGEEGQFFNANSADREPIAAAKFMNSGVANELAILDLSIV